ncbi:hypothetical protein LAZ67_13003144 [Cordylochernes scorpioides]|uniref:CCHC-type domain-containing protein n=1 Tax=Cordylochernes scorpioides TaxID=51811 RepID=A0ABY6L519_9ARAC|nr:hypothetical protein LAZ67_13003144 [Cordylochernes scorpioides]
MADKPVSLADLKRLRTPMRIIFTRTYNELLAEFGKEDFQREDIDLGYIRLQGHQEKFENLNEHIMAALMREQGSDDDIAAEFEYVEDYQQGTDLLQATTENSAARKVVESFPPSANNYPKVIDYLKSRFGENEMLVEMYLRDLLQNVFQKVREQDKISIVKLYDKLEAQLKALETLNVTRDKHSSMLYPLVESALPEDALRVWEKSQVEATPGAAGQKLKDKLTRLMEFLKTELAGENKTKHSGEPDVILEKMEALKKMRSPLRGLMTKKVAEIERIIEDDPTNRQEILTLHLQLKRLGQKAEALNGRIGSLLMEENAKEDLFEAEVDGCNAYECILDAIEVKVQKALESIAAVQQERKGSTSASMEKRICKLPKLELLKFNGTLKEWLPWWGQFERIHQDDSLSGIDKFHYLHQAVTKGSRAQKFLEGYTVTEANYIKAIEALKEKFGDRVLLTEMYVRQLLELIVERASSQRRTLADLYDPLVASLRSLESLGVTADQNAVFLYPMVESSLPDDVLQIWQRRPEAGYQSGDNTGEPGSSQRLSDLLKFIKEEIRGAERLEFVRAGFKRAEKMPEKEIQRRTCPTAAHLLNQSISESCAFCDMANHTSRNCSRAKWMTLEQRRQRATRAKVCFRCLGRRHVARECRSRFKCFVCGGRHVELMCSRRIQEMHEKKAYVKEDNLEAPLTSMADQTCSSEVLLLIASARVASPRGQRIVRVLFDSGSQRSYIRRALIGQLNLEKIGQEQIQKALFGGGMTGVEKHGIYRIQLENIRKGNKIGIDVLEEKTICDRTTFIPMGVVETLGKQGTSARVQ